MPKFIKLSAGLIALGAFTATAIAGEEASKAQSYQPGYFDKYAPRNALDMLNRIPGFQLDSGSSKRGLGQGGANVLINGARLSGKSSDPFDLVRRIPAQNVVKIDIVDGAALDIPGFSGQVADITVISSGITGSWEWSPQLREILQPDLLQGYLTLSGETGNLAYTAKIKNDTGRGGHAGPEERRLANGDLFELRDESARYDNENPGLSVGLTWTPKAEHIAHVNAEYNQYNYNSLAVSHLTSFAAPGIDGQHIYSAAEDEWNMKIDGDYELPVSFGRLKLIGYYRFENSPVINRFDIYDNRLGHVEGTRFYQNTDEAESIFRTEYSWAGDNYDWQIGAEGAFNYLENDSQLIDLITPSQSEDITHSRVEEKRGEINLTHGRKLSPKWDLQLSLSGEYSQLTQGVLERTFYRPKGFLSTSYSPTDNFKIRTRLEREVGQLNFYDFISSVSLTDNLNTAGNPHLVPNQNWKGEMEFDRRFIGDNSLRLRVYGVHYSDLIGRIPLGENQDAIGNIDNAHRYGVDINTTLKGERWGLDGTELNLSLDLRKSSVEDPLEKFKRRLNSDKILYWSIGFRHDIPNSDWAYGFYSERYKEAPVYRLKTISQASSSQPYGELYVEQKNIFGLKVKLALSNIFGAADDYSRIYYTKRRDQGVLDFTENRSRAYGQSLRMTMSGNF